MKSESQQSWANPRPNVENKTQNRVPNFRKECVPTKCATLLFLWSKSKTVQYKRLSVAAGAAIRRNLTLLGGSASTVQTPRKVRETLQPRHHLADHTQRTYTIPDQLSIGESTRLRLERRTASPHMTKTSIYTTRTQTHALHIQIYICKYTYMYIYICVYTYMYIYIYIYTFMGWLRCVGSLQ